MSQYLDIEALAAMLGMRPNCILRSLVRMPEPASTGPPEGWVPIAVARAWSQSVDVRARQMKRQEKLVDLCHL